MYTCTLLVPLAPAVPALAESVLAFAVVTVAVLALDAAIAVLLTYVVHLGSTYIYGVSVTSL